MSIYYQPYWIDENELEHFGIKGMRWGVRRYQNEDGTLTEAGKERYGTKENFEAAKEQMELKRYKAAKTAKEVAKVAGVMGAFFLTGSLMSHSFAKASASTLVKIGESATKNALSNSGKVTVQSAVKDLEKIVRVGNYARKLRNTTKKSVSYVLDQKKKSQQLKQIRELEEFMRQTEYINQQASNMMMNQLLLGTMF